MDERNLKKIAVVTGDVTIDWNLALFPKTEDGTPGGAWWKDTGARTYRQRGGAALLADLVKQVSKRLRTDKETDWDVRSIDLSSKTIYPGDGRFHHSHAAWSRFKDKDPAWRVTEYIGLSRRLSGEKEEWQMVKGDMPEADLVILDDADLGFRDSKELWPGSLYEERPPWILVKMARPVAQGALWDHLHKNCAERLIVVMTVNDLRRTEVQISRELSWERTAQDLYWELIYNPRVNALSRCAHVIVSFDTAGAFLMSRSERDIKAERSDDPFECTLFYDPAIVEGMWNQSFPGGMIGYTTCLTAGIARQLMLKCSDPDLHQGIQSGLSAMRFLHTKGYTEPDGAKSQRGLSFPVGSIAKELCSEKQVFKTAPVPRVGAGDAHGGWAIFKNLFSKSMETVARNIVLEGVEESLEGVPLGQFGKLITADRREVESFRSIRSLIGEYCGQSLSKPLSIAVFGPPGSGKSFAVKEIAASVRPGKIKELEFNLSQFGSVNDLYDAFHQVRDAALSGKMPLVFWDEFDSTFENQPLGWLRYFLAPMQDGAFLDGEIKHPIGRCIFVFAGGTCCRMEDFTSLLEERQFIQMKGPDFVSRIKGYINILGPNPYTTEEDTADPYFLVRRAIILRVILNINVPQAFHRDGGIKKLSIDRGVLRALLHIGEYKHGVRSIESIIAMSNLTGKAAFERSSLPPEAQLNLHVNGREFIALVRQLELEGIILEKFAETAHEIYCHTLREDNWKWDPEKDPDNKKTPLLVPYEELDEIYKESNRVTVRNIPAKLRACGYFMVPVRGDEPPLDFPGDDLEKLAMLEHELWWKSKREQGFTLGKPTLGDPMRSEHMVEWDKLPDKIKNIDRELVKGIPSILATAGYTVEKIAKEDVEEDGIEESGN